MNNRIQYFAPSGAFRGTWGVKGYGYGQFQYPTAVEAAGDYRIYVTDYSWHQVQYFTATGSYFDRWGTQGTADGQFNFPDGVAASPTGTTIYVADTGNDRIQYFRRNEPAVAPTSLGKVKALFR
jgi:DNA-binding beta-propeller fold protein YncE